MTDTTHIAIRHERDVVLARMAARDTAKLIGLMPIDQARVATAVSELARNIFLYAGTGMVHIRRIQRNGRLGVEIVCADEGPGLADLDIVMQDGYSTSRGMGMGLPGAKRLMDEFTIWSEQGHGTKITCLKWRA